MIWAFFLSSLIRQETHLPREWFGLYRGKIQIQSLSKTSKSVDMELSIFPVEGSDSTTWSIIYRSDEKVDERKYLLKSIENRPNQFTIDENNGIRIGAYLQGNNLISSFTVLKTLITTKFSRTEKGIHIEMMSFDTSEVEKTEANSGEKVESYALKAFQCGDLELVKGS